MMSSIQVLSSSRIRSTGFAAKNSIYVDSSKMRYVVSYQGVKRFGEQISHEAHQDSQLLWLNRTCSTIQ